MKPGNEKYPIWLFVSAMLLILVVLASGLMSTHPYVPSHQSLYSLFGDFNYNNFLENFFADALIAVAFGLFIPSWIKSFARPKQVEIIDRSTMSDSIVISQKENRKEFTFSSELAIRNTGQIALLNRIYIHIFIPKHIQYSVAGAVKMTAMKETMDGYNYIRGQIEVPIYPTAVTEFVKLKGSFFADELIDNSIHYSIVTEFGDYPRVRFGFLSKKSYLGSLRLV